MDPRRVEAAVQGDGCLSEGTHRVGHPVGMGVGRDEIDVGILRRERERRIEIRHAGIRRAAEQAARPAKQRGERIVRVRCQELIEQVSRLRVIEQPPAGETGAGERRVALRIRGQPRVVARKNHRPGVGMHRQHARRDARVVAERVGEAAQHELRLDAPAIALDAGGLRLDDARELLHGLLVPALVDVDLSLLRRARLRVGEIPGSRDKERSRDENHVTGRHLTS